MGPDRSTGWPADDGTTPKEVPVRWNRFGKQSDDAKAAVLDAAHRQAQVAADVKERLAPAAEDVRARVAVHEFRELEPSGAVGGEGHGGDTIHPWWSSLSGVA